MNRYPEDGIFKVKDGKPGCVLGELTKDCVWEQLAVGELQLHLWFGDLAQYSPFGLRTGRTGMLRGDWGGTESPYVMNFQFRAWRPRRASVFVRCWRLEGKSLVSFKVIFIGVTNFAFTGSPQSQTCGSVSFSIYGGIFWAGLSMSFIMLSSQNIPLLWFSEKVRVILKT